MFTQAEARKEINKIAKRNGFIMRKQNATLGGKTLYQFENRKTGRVIYSNMTFWSAYDSANDLELAIKDGRTEI